MRRLAIALILILISGCVSGPLVHVDSPKNVVPWNPFDCRKPLDIAAAVVERVTYKSEMPANHWQHPTVTYESKTGDCEDFALLMVVALMAEDYDAYVVRGSAWSPFTQRWHGHAWVGLKVAGVEYFIDSTSKTVTIDSPDEEGWADFTIRARIRYIDGVGYIQ